VDFSLFCLWNHEGTVKMFFTMATTICEALCKNNQFKFSGLFSHFLHLELSGVNVFNVVYKTESIGIFPGILAIFLAFCQFLS